MKKFVLAAAGLCCVTLALAQSTNSDPVAERMERAKRDAANPLRIIIEASQAKRTKAESGAPVVAAPAAPARAAAAPRAAARTEAPVRSTALAERTADAESPAPVAAAVPASLAPTAPTVEPTPTGAAATSPQQLATASPRAAVPSPAVEAPLKLARYIEPEIPSRIRGRLKPSNEVTVAFQIQPDGSVSNVDIRASSAKLLDPVVLEAVRQWRYDPLPAAREHTVQLVFNLGE